MARIRDRSDGALLVTFDDHELSDARAASAAATERSRHIPNMTRFDLSRSQAETDLIGLFGEFAVSIVTGHGLESCGLLLKGVRLDGGRDHDHVSVQVKTMEVRRPTPQNLESFWWVLDTVKREDFTATYGVLCYMLPTCEVVVYGYCTQLSFLLRHEYHNLGFGLRVGIRAHNLKPMTTWAAIAAGVVR